MLSVHSGHSVTALKKNYNRSSLESIGKEWFAITRDDGGLQMPLLSLPNVTRFPAAIPNLAPDLLRSESAS